MSPLSRRHIVASAAALPTLALPAVGGSLAQEPDPIFAAIEKHHMAEAAFIARSDYEDDLEESGHKLPRATDDWRTPEMVAVVTAARTARAELATTAPITLAGMVAYLDYVLSESNKLDELLFVDARDDGDDEVRDFLRSLARGARQIAHKAVLS